MLDSHQQQWDISHHKDWYSSKGTRAGTDLGRKRHSFITGGNVNWSKLFGKK